MKQQDYERKIDQEVESDRGVTTPDRQFLRFSSVPLATQFQRLISMDRNDDAFAGDPFWQRYVTALDSRELPAFCLNHTRNPCLKPASNGELQNLIADIFYTFRRTRFEPKLNRFPEIEAKFIHVFRLCDAARQRRNLGPKTTFLSLMNNGSQSHIQPID